MNGLGWQAIQNMKSHSYSCGYCGHSLASDQGWPAFCHDGTRQWVGGTIYVCHHCGRPTFFDVNNRNKQYPGVPFGRSVQNVTDAAINEIYEEARRATSAGSFTAAVLCCRKLLMHLAVAKGAKAGDTFKGYVEYLAKNNYVPPDCALWVDQIRETGNEANHEIMVMKREDAEHLISFCEMLLKIFYEFPAVARARNAPQTVVAAK